MTIKDLCKKAHAQAKEKGFWEREIYNDNFRAKTRLKPRNLGELLMLIVSELGEACEALRHNNRQQSEKEFKEKISKIPIQAKHLAVKDRWVKDTFEDELADAVIRIADLAESEGIDLEWQICKKLEYNKTRPHKHGGKLF